MKKILVLGGSYFLGRVFTRLASKNADFEIHTLNRGNYPLKIETIKQYVSDRRDPVKLASVLPNTHWDAVIDFCAYEPGDIATAISAIPGTIGQYIFISTCSVYEPLAPSPKTENSPLMMSDSEDMGIHYAYNKRILEEEAKQVCQQKNIALTLVRPAFIYGPFNYAPREQFYFNALLEGKAIPVPTDATGRFQFVYVKDAAHMLVKCVGNAATYGDIYNFSAPEVITYKIFMETLSSVHPQAFEAVPVKVEQVLAENIPIPFPLSGNECYEGKKASEILGFQYTSFKDGLQETYGIYMDAHKK